MSPVGRNVVANFAGQLWSALMGVLFIPVYIHLLGLEAFGLVGFFVTLQALSVVFDLGLAGTINRELARRGSVEPQSTRDLVRTLEWTYWLLGIAVALLVWTCSGLLATYWLQPVEFDRTRASTALGLMGATLGAQWPSAFYAAGLNGLQRQVLSNILTALFGTLRGAGVLIPLLVLDPTIEVFFTWHAAIAAIQSFTCAVVFWSVLPAGTRRARFSVFEVARIGRFTSGLSAIALLSFVLAYADRIVLSRQVPLDQFGVYVIASSVAAALLRFVQPWFNAFYPRFSEMQARNDWAALCTAYHVASQWLAATVLPVAVVVAVFAEDLLRLWTRDPILSIAASPILTLLVCGTAANGLMHLPYALQLAYGWTRLALLTNIVSVLLVVPIAWWLAKAFGAVGVAAIWPVLNLAYVSFVLPLMHRRIMRGELASWYVSDVGPSLVASVGVALLLRTLFPSLPDGLAGLAGIAGIYVAVAMAAIAATRRPREFARASVVGLFARA